ncbi:alkaline phosphatase, tissue-nonspecific isozyme-like [Asterias rubens]|uniref:alkaline phosphatase, tissue-nonspecific isozyme-like n=1 Tax=Asterias rubens TaxID=7604 RepID=UPI001455D9C1|nr:alkaline phosphatase, tissue-nonspecific isozyme-like [Asterias rubens]
MGIPTVTAARILKGQQAGNTGEETVLAWEDFPHAALSKTYNTNAQGADSAGTATAFFCGVKTKSGVIGVDDQVIRSDCKSGLNASVDSIMIDAQKAGKATGFISTARVTHATPACLYAHSPNRNWENDADIPPEEAAYGCTDIAQQLITLGKNTKVILGGGRAEMTPNDVADVEYPTRNGSRQDGRNLIDEWLESKDSESSSYVWNLDQFNAVDPENTEYLLGLFERSHMQFEVDRKDDAGGEPSVAEMVEKAIKILEKDKDGFFLMVEGGRIDHAHHDGNAAIALTETIAFEEGLIKALELTSDEDTLYIVTADHSHVMSMGGYPSRGNPILGLYDLADAADGMPYTTLSYANGPGGIQEQTSYQTTGRRRNLTEANFDDPTFFHSAIFPVTSETHGGEDVAIYAHGPMSHLLHGVQEQNYIPHVVRYAACLGNTEHCDGYVNPCTGGASASIQRDLAGICLVLLSSLIPIFLN